MNDPYYSWRGMMARCYQGSHQKYHRYGGRGISVCERWHTYSNFLEDMGSRPEGMTLNRVDNDGDYEPSNCEWSTLKDQNRNRQKHRMVNYQGETKPLSQWAEEKGILRETLRARLDAGMSVEESLSRPVDPQIGFTLRAFRSTWGGVISIVFEVSEGKARNATLRGARSAGYRARLTEIKVRRAKEFDSIQHLDGVPITPGQCYEPSLIARWLESAGQKEGGE